MMDTTQVTEILREGIWVAIKVCGPMLLLSMLVGVLLAIFQAVTQITSRPSPSSSKWWSSLRCCSLAGDG